MNIWDSDQQIQRIIDGFDLIDRHLQEYRDLQKSLRLCADMSLQAKELLKRYSQLETTGRAILDSTVQVLKAAVKPFPDIRSLIPSVNLGAIWDSYQRLNTGIIEANFIAELDLPLSNSDEERDGEIADQAEKLLDELEYTPSLQALRQVKFVPFTLLEKALLNPRLMYNLDPRDFEGFIAGLLDQLGFENVVLTPKSNDEGRDVLALTKIHGISVICAFECKRYSPARPVGPEIARALLGTITHGSTRATKGILVTTSTFSPGARKFILTEPQLDGRDFDGIVEWLNEYRERRLG